MSVFSAIKRWWSGLFNPQSIKDAFGVTIAVTPTMLQKQEQWRQILRGEAAWNDENTPSLMLAGVISAEVAQNVVVGLESDVTGGEKPEGSPDAPKNPRSAYLNEQYIRVKEKLESAVIAACNGGEIIFKPYIDGGRLEITLCESECYWPVEYNTRDELVDVVFGATIQRGEYVYKLVERHTFNEQAQAHSIAYRAFRSKIGATGITPDSLGDEIPLTSVPEWAHLRDITIAPTEKPLFVHFKIPSKINIETPQRQGLPIWSVAIEMLRKADQQESRTDWEFEGGELAIDAPIDWFAPDGRGNPVLPKGKERLFRTFDNGATKEQTAVPYNPEFRIVGLDLRMNQILRRIEFLCGLSYGILSDNNTQDKTAEEFKASKRRFFVTVSGIQEALKKAMEHLVYAFNILADIQNIPRGEYELTWVPSDAIMADREREFDERIRAQNAGWLSMQENRAWWLDVDVNSEQAKNVPTPVEDEF